MKTWINTGNISLDRIPIGPNLVKYISECPFGDDFIVEYAIASFNYSENTQHNDGWVDMNSGEKLLVVEYLELDDIVQEEVCHLFSKSTRHDHTRELKTNLSVKLGNVGVDVKNLEMIKEKERLRGLLFDGAPDWVSLAFRDDTGTWYWLGLKMERFKNGWYSDEEQDISPNQPDTYLELQDSLVRR